MRAFPSKGAQLLLRVTVLESLRGPPGHSLGMPGPGRFLGFVERRKSCGASC